jgi:thiosulfate/3-mercaptopyruvate sulfurtransferase
MRIHNISTEELLAQLDNPEYVLLDIRPSAAYNGWKLKGEVCGGHIRGAISFPFSWIKELSKQELKPLLSSKGITSTNMVVVYGYEPDNCSVVVELLWNLGIEKVFVYEAGLQEWATESSLPMDHLINYEKLVHPEWVEKFISCGKPEYHPGERAVLFEVSHRCFEEYKVGHIPGACHFDLASIECSPSWNVCSDNELLKILLAHGITATSMIILYGRNTMAVARAANVLMYAGVEDVRLMDGGFDAWLKAEYAVETGLQQPIPVEDFGRDIPGHPEYIIDIDRVKELLAEDQSVLVSVRSWDEYIGKTSGYDYIQAKGHIAGALWGYSGSDPHHMQDYRNPDDTMRSYHEIESNWQKAGITPDKKVAFYCGSGWRASETFFYAYLMGWQNIAVYDGGWLEWSQDADNPISSKAP